MPSVPVVEISPSTLFSPLPLNVASPEAVLATAPELPLGTYLVQFFLLTGIVLVLGIFLLRYLRDRLPGLALPSGGSRNLRVVERVALDPQRSAYILAAGQRQWLLVSSGDRVTTVAELGRHDLTPDFPSAVEKESTQREKV
ncbi:MAG: flagellar biosynthetic protein FliO [Candidatus Sericytochromatia bacterium]|nr:flagellar biosynthetic protein FliO [Candidatus Sericytochromatia bacterium]